MALRIAVAGLGRRGRQWVEQIAHSGEHELTACAEPDAGARAEAAAQLGLAPERCQPTLAQAMDAQPCDAVVVAAPHEHHRPLCEEAISAGKATLVEKPFALSLEDAAALVDLGEREGVPIVVGQNVRYLRGQRALQRVVREGTLGRIREVVCQSYRVPGLMGGAVSSRHEIAWSSAVHHLDALRHSIGELSGVMADMGDGRSIQALLAFENGARGVYAATYESSGHQFFERGQEFYERIVGEDATLHMNQRWVFVCPNGKLPRPVRRGKRHQTEELILIAQLEHALRTHAEPEAGGRDNLHTVAAVEACTRSAEAGAWVDPRELLVAAGT
jgi:predicted dehydrogenase